MLARLDHDVLDAGPKRAGRERFCAVTRAVKPVAELIRFVVAPDGSVVPDLKQNLPGRGLWVTADRQTVDLAAKRKLFGKGFKREVRHNADIGEETARLLERAALDALAIAGKAGEVVCGFAKVEAALARGGVIGLLHARDGGADGLRKLEALRRALASADMPVVTAFSGAQLDLALGRSNVIHAALLAGPASQGFLTRFSRMMRFRTGETSRPASRRASGEGPKGSESE